MNRYILLVLTCLILASCAVKKAAPTLNEGQLNFAKPQSALKHDIQVIVMDEREKKLHSSKILGFLKDTYSTQLKKMGHAISTKSANKLIIYVNNYAIELSGSICTTKAKFKYSYSYGSTMTSTHDIEDSESAVPCFTRTRKYESTEKLMDKMLVDFNEWFIKYNKAAKKMKK